MRTRRKCVWAVGVFIFLQITNLLLLSNKDTASNHPQTTEAEYLGHLTKYRSVVTRNNSAGSTQIYSAVVSNSTDDMSWDRIAVQGWATGYTTADRFICCVKHSSGIVLQYRSVQTQPWVGHLNSTIIAWQHRCYLERDNIDDIPSMVAVIPYSDRCHSNYDEYTDIEFAYRYPGKIAVFGKVLYSQLNSDDLLAWFEIHKTIGLEMVLAHVTENLNEDAMKVLNFYKHKGLVELLHYPLPGPVDVMDADTPQCWNFKGVSAFDGSERLVGYDFVVSMDPDEYLIPNHDKDWKTVFDRLLSQNPNAAGFLFQTYLHIKSWKPYQKSIFTVGRYLNRSRPTLDRIKHVTIPRRLKPGGMRPHSFLYADEYTGHTANVTDIAIHHYRECRALWLIEAANISCNTMERIYDHSVYDLLKSVEKEVLRLKQLLNV